MRSVWIAAAAAVALLALAAWIRRGPAGDEPTEPPPPQTLAADDLARIVELRAEFAGMAGRGRFDGGSNAAFERKLRQVAGLAQEPAASEGISERTGTGSAGESGGVPSRPALLRQAAAALDGLSDQAEESGDYPQADELRALGDMLRRVARNLKVPDDFQAKSPPEALERLIDNAQAPQAQ